MKTFVGALGLIGTLIAGMAVAKMDETAGGVVFIAGLVVTAIAVARA